MRSNLRQFMKKLLTIGLTSFICATGFCQSKVSIDSVSKHIGDSVMVCNKVYGVKSLEKISFINLGANYPKSPLTIVVRAEARDLFPMPLETMYDNKNICVTGSIKEYKGRDEIEVRDPRQITIEP